MGGLKQVKRPWQEVLSNFGCLGERCCRNWLQLYSLSKGMTIELFGGRGGEVTNSYVNSTEYCIQTSIMATFNDTFSLVVTNPFDQSALRTQQLLELVWLLLVTQTLHRLSCFANHQNKLDFFQKEGGGVTLEKALIRRNM